MNKLVFDKMTMKNFLSFGNNQIEVPLRDGKFTVILGENWDTGGEESRNGVGKSAILDAICYALYGKTTRGISNPKLVNKLARRGQSMLVTLEFERNNNEYLIERGEKPSVLRLFKRPKDSDEAFKTRDGEKFKFDITQNKSETNERIESLVGFDIIMFEYLIGNSSETIPFMKLPEDKRRDIVEKLFGFDQLSIRGKELKEERKEYKTKLTAAESHLEATRQANRRIQDQIDSLTRKQQEWDKSHRNEIDDLKSLIGQLEQVDVNEEMEILKTIQELSGLIIETKTNYKEIEATRKSHIREMKNLEINTERNLKDIGRLGAELESLDRSECPTCKQHWEPNPEYRENISEQIRTLEVKLKDCEFDIEQYKAEIETINLKLSDIKSELDDLESCEREASQIDLIYSNLEEAASAETTLNHYRGQLEHLLEKENPHSDSIRELNEKALVDIDDSEVSDLRSLIVHYNLLIELLMDKDSFIRKAIIEKWLPTLNHIISVYMGELEIPHRVRFKSDMSMEIVNFKEEFDWGNLSKGQRQRVVVSLNLAFQDVYEAIKSSTNLLFVDELIDSGICNRGASNVVNRLKHISTNKDKRVMLVTHRDDIAAQVEDVMKIIMQNNISRIE